MRLRSSSLESGCFSQLVKRCGLAALLCTFILTQPTLAAFTEFCCRNGGSNLNAGTRSGSSTEPGTSADFTYASGNWVQSTGVFTVASGNPQSDGVAVGDFASVYPDGSSVGVYIGRVTARNTTTITVSTTAKAGSSPSDGTGNRTLKIGGAWAGPNGSEDFPFDLATLHTLTNSSGDYPRVNMKNAAEYSISAAITPSSPAAGPTVQGYTSSYGDLGKAVINGGTSGAAYAPWGSSANWRFYDLEVKNNGATGNAGGSFISGLCFRCVIHDIRGDGFACMYAEECEGYACNTANGSGRAAFATVAYCVRCIAHDNTNTNNAGFMSNAGFVVCINCIGDTNGGNGNFFIANAGGGGMILIGCDSYNSSGDGFKNAKTNTTTLIIENCNFVKNAGYGVNLAGAVGPMVGHVRNCGFGAGTQVNTSGQTNGVHATVIEGSVTYANDVTPWVDPANGDWRINLTAAKAAGRGSYTQTAASYTGAIGYPDIGAAQHQDSGGGGAVDFFRGFVR